MRFKRVFFYILAVVALAYFYLVYISYTENKKYAYDMSVTSQIKTIQQYKSIINERIEQQKIFLEEMAKFIQTKDQDKDYTMMKEVLSIAARAGNFLAVYASYVDTFKVVASNDVEPVYDFTSRPWFKPVKEKMMTIFTEPYIDRQFHFYIISISTPLIKDGKFIGTLAIDLDFEILQKELAALFPLANGSAFLMTNGKNILDQTGQILDFEDEKVKNILSQISAKKQGDEQIFINQKPYIFVYDTLANSDWMLVSVLDEHSIYKQVKQKALKDLGIFLMLIFFGLCAFIWMYITQYKFHKNKYLLNLFSKNPIGGLVITDNLGNIAFINKEFEKIFGLKFKANIGKNLKDFKDIFSQEQSTTQILKEISSNPTRRFSLKTRQDELFYRVEFMPLLEKNEKFYGIFIAVYNITHEINLESSKQKQEQILLQNAKMAALGEMVSAISHQYKQPLNTLLLLISDTQEKLGAKNEQQIVSENIANMRLNVELMNETINVFRNFYKDDFEEKSFNLLDIVDDVLYICRPQLQVKNIELRLLCDDETYEITSYPTYIKHVLMNVIMNAKDELVKKSRQKGEFHACVIVRLSQNSKSIIIQIEDNADGISDDLAERLFEPFFTTKGSDGTGIGLYLCKLMFEKKLRGNISLVSAANPTKFQIELLK